MYEAIAPWFDYIYSRDEFVSLFSKVLPSLSDRTGPEEELRVLDLCCGTGRALSLFADHPRARLCGVDNDERMLEAARKAFPSAVFKLGDVRELSQNDFDVDSFDLIFMIGLGIQHLSTTDRSSVFRSVAKSLRPGGAFIFDIMNEDALEKGPLIRYSILIGDQRVTIIYVRHFEKDKLYQYYLVIKSTSAHNESPSLEHDCFVLYRLTPDAALTEAARSGFSDISSLAVDYNRATFLCARHGS